jgi:hypothetical protein
MWNQYGRFRHCFASAWGLPRFFLELAKQSEVYEYYLEFKTRFNLVKAPEYAEKKNEWRSGGTASHTVMVRHPFERHSLLEKSFKGWRAAGAACPSRPRWNKGSNAQIS